MNEIDLISGLCAENLSAINYFVKNNQQYVFILCFKMLNNKEVAEEITQDVLIKCIEKINYFEGKSKLKTWVYKIAYNEALNYLRQNKPIVTDLTDELFKTGKSSLSNNLFQQDLKCFINQHFDKLPADQKEILTLFYLET